MHSPNLEERQKQNEVLHNLAAVTQIKPSTLFQYGNINPFKFLNNGKNIL
jgi:hypothetical protein